MQLNLLRQASRIATRTTRFATPSRIVAAKTNFNQLNWTPVRFYGDAGLTKDQIQARIFDLLKGYEKVNVEALTAEAHFNRDLKLDSLDTVEVVMAIEEEFSIEIPDHDADEIKSVADAINYISQREDAH
ncbi:acyl carrier-like protein [Conidiobolus coronatus NRRL 28638]|uniref:Acyl carrier protein n=1 Tax=Conidiobolus coronatus (strain ATCC 28846 / CBS 209.66 / NRRL 28638) TaxID=796925 RepID=A0A137PBE7_CONC2|nr:acyl carrier-like protein [Conidiobolus coronatus NRRL 28638]|eukprot:KXN72304.1 acyl carrier-like protein [Conidiobolus coronatus NRRL 28638]